MEEIDFILTWLNFHRDWTRFSFLNFSCQQVKSPTFNICHCC